jgi:hypothetical protein
MEIRRYSTADVREERYHAWFRSGQRSCSGIADFTSNMLGAHTMSPFNSPAGDGVRTNPRDRYPTSPRRASTRHHRAVPDRDDGDVVDGRHRRRAHGRGRSTARVVDVGDTRGHSSVVADHRVPDRGLDRRGLRRLPRPTRRDARPGRGASHGVIPFRPFSVPLIAQRFTRATVYQMGNHPRRPFRAVRGMPLKAINRAFEGNKRYVPL